MDREDYLYHYGVHGMKWGIRKDRRNGVSSRIKSKIQRSNKPINDKERIKEIKNKKALIKNINDNERIKEIKNKKTSIKNISDHELQNKVRRLQLEKQYRDLKKDEVSTGRKILGDILKTSGKALGVAVATYVGGTAINKVFNTEIVRTKKKK